MVVQPEQEVVVKEALPKMKTIFVFILTILGLNGYAQSDIDLLLKEYNERTVPYISVDELDKGKDKYLILDTRKKAEYDVSHIPGAIWVSESVNDSIYAFAKAKKDTPIVLYCSVGVRSEDFGEQLQELGFTNVKNLYGSIFSWKDQDKPIVNKANKPTDSVHVYSKLWSKYLKKGIKVTQPTIDE